MTSVLPGSRSLDIDKTLDAVDLDLDFDEVDVVVVEAGAMVESGVEAEPDAVPPSAEFAVMEPAEPAVVEPTVVESAVIEPPAAEPAVVELTDRERDMLVFERQWWRHAGSKEQAIRERFNLSATRYYQALNALLEAPAAVAFDPMVVGRLRRLRATRARKRAGR